MVSAIQSCALGVAGPVRNGEVELTNLGWKFSDAELSPLIEAPVVLLNDLEANAHGIFELESDQILTLQSPPELTSGPAALISAGTGLGMALMPFVQGKHYPQATESGHADFAPRNLLERNLHAYLEGLYGRATWEHVLSGPGLGNIYDFLLETAQAEPHQEIRDARLAGEDSNAAIAKLACAKPTEDSIATQALELFTSLYASEAGNLALRTLCFGGLWIGGGIAPKIQNQLKRPQFLKDFTEKKPFQKLLETIPVRVILDSDCALWGAARVAFSTANEALP